MIPAKGIYTENGLPIESPDAQYGQEKTNPLVTINK